MILARLGSGHLSLGVGGGALGGADWPAAGGAGPQLGLYLEADQAHGRLVGARTNNKRRQLEDHLPDTDFLRSDHVEETDNRRQEVEERERELSIVSIAKTGEVGIGEAGQQT